MEKTEKEKTKKTIKNIMIRLGKIVIICLIQFVIQSYIASRYEKSMNLYIKVREQASKVGEYLAIVHNLKEDSSTVDYERANQLSWELALRLPSDIYKNMVQGIVYPNEDNNTFNTIIEVRKLLLGEKGYSLSGKDIAIHGPGYRKYMEENKSD